MILRDISKSKMDNPTEENSQVLASDIGSNIIKATRRETVEFVSAGLKHHQGYSFGDGFAGSNSL